MVLRDITNSILCSTSKEPRKWKSLYKEIMKEDGNEGCREEILMKRKLNTGYDGKESIVVVKRMELENLEQMIKAATQSHRQ